MPRRAVLFDPDNNTWLNFETPLEIIEAQDLGDVLPALQKIETLVEEQGLYAAGFLSYEAASAFDPACRTHPADEFPLLRFGLFRTPKSIELPEMTGSGHPLDWRPNMEAGPFTEAVEKIRNAIARGETYQVNFTFALEALFRDDPWNLFLSLAGDGKSPGAGFLDADRWAICSISPELFFDRKETRLTMRPMKGTAARGLYPEDDRRNRQWLAASAKNRAENIMILDMARNDLGRLAVAGSVETTSLCALEKYPTVWQMTSTVKAISHASQTDVFSALFPCASITGAPKPRTVQIISDLEKTPRRIYTGAFGWMAPGRRAHFSVAIRTVLIDRQEQRATYGVGAGITWDSDSAEEYQECLTKADALTRPAIDFQLLETLRWAPGHGYFLLERHLERMQASADYFNYPFDAVRTRHHLEELSASFPLLSQRIRLLLDKEGDIQSEATPLQLQNQESPLRLELAKQPVDSRERFLYHKTTRRRIYEEALACSPQADEIVLWNERGEITECCTANLVVEIDGRLVTPPVASGLLAGTYRAELLQRGCLHEQVLSRGDLSRSSKIYLINAVRKWRRATLAG
jgi:para-aminobenzoate synthetase/4-amino-4-deoxychorismate lyase